MMSGCSLQRTPGSVLSGLGFVSLEPSKRWFILRPACETLKHSFWIECVKSSVNHKGTKPAHSHLIHDGLRNRFLAQSPTGFLSFCLPNSSHMAWVGLGEGTFTYQVNHNTERESNNDLLDGSKDLYPLHYCV